MKKGIRTLNVARLALFPLGYGIVGAFVGGTLNRIMISELALPALLVGFLFAVELFIAPVRVWLGYRSDGYPIFGKRREVYMIAGMLVSGLSLAAIVPLVVGVGAPTITLILGGVVLFAVYELGRNLAHNTFHALIADTFGEKGKKRAITGYEVATLFGFVMGAGVLGSALPDYDPGRLIAVAIGAVAVAFVLTLVATVAQENSLDAELTERASRRARDLSFGQAVKQLVASDPQIRLFFVIVVFTMMGTLAQDVLLEPYGALVLGMSVGETTRLTSFWGLGVLVSLLISGMVLVNWLGHMRVMRIGMIATMIVFGGVIAAGMAGRPDLFRVLVLFMGLGTGLAGAGLLAGIISFTTRVRAGMLMGLWGFANLTGRSVGALMGGGIVDGVTALSGSTLTAYGLVFAVEALLLGVAFVLTFRLQPEEAAIESEMQFAAGAAK